MGRAKRRMGDEEPLLAPPPERRARGEVERLPRAIADERGRPARPYRAPDMLLLMERRGTIAALGGIASPAGSCVWHVVGAEWTLKDWALREGWGGRPLSAETASGVLIGALGVLQALYGL